MLKLAALVLLISACPARADDEHRSSRRSAQAGLLTDRIIFTQIPVEGAKDGAIAGSGTAASARDDLPRGSRIVVFDPTVPQAGVTVLTPGFAAAGRPDLSFDGRRMLFIGKRGPADPVHVWEMGINGEGLRQITNRSADCTAAIYLSTLYTMDAEQPEYQVCFCGQAGDGGARVLFACRLDGTHLRRITFNPHGVSDPYLLSDGRLLFSNRQAVAGADSPLGGGVLFTVNTDGTDVFVFAGADGPPVRRAMPCETPDGWVVFVESTTATVDGGALVAVRRARSLHTRRMVASDSAGFYHSPSPLPDGNLLVSYRPRNGGSYGVHLLDWKHGTRAAKLFDSPRWHEVDAQVLRARPEPAGRSSVVDEAWDYGFLYCLDAYLTGLTRASGTGRRAIARVQVFEAVAREAREPEQPRQARNQAATAVGEKLLGEVPVESDGSFYMALPARTPVRLRTLDADGNVLQAMRSWIWVMPREGRGCIGCHEDRELTPPNRHVFALRQQPHAVGTITRREPERERLYEPYKIHGRKE